MITDAELYYYRWDELIEKELDRVVRLLVAKHGEEAAATMLRCSATTLRRLLKVLPVPDLSGAPVVEVSLQDVMSDPTVDAFTMIIGKGLLEAMRGLGLIRELERFFGTSARSLGRVMSWAG